MFPNAISPLECLTGHHPDQAYLVWVLFWLCLTNGFEYLIIAIRWIYLFDFSVIQFSLMVIFLLCAICGYWSFCLSCFDANAGYSAKLSLLCILKVANYVFLVSTYGKTFVAETRYNRIGRRLTKLAKQNHIAKELLETVSDAK